MSLINQPIQNIMKTNYFLIAFAAILFLASCSDDDDPIPAPAAIAGCMDARSLNYNPGATIDNGNCEYSQVTFYGKYSAYNTAFGLVFIDHVEVYVDGNAVGAFSAYYPNGPGNCSSPGTVSYQFQDRNTVDWNSIVYLVNGTQLFGSGTITPNGAECIKVNVTL